MSPELERVFQLLDVVQPVAMEHRRRMIDAGARFAHYTTAENALNIVRSREFWMRDTRSMTDWSEVHRGGEALRAYFRLDGKAAAFRDAVNSAFPGLAEEVGQLFDGWWPHISDSTFICCVSEHDRSEDLHGRLSMWRAYGRNVPAVALVFHLPIDTDINDLRIYATPVLYQDTTQFHAMFDRVIANILESRAFLLTFERDRIKHVLYLMFLLASVSLKHPGFHEEREWRAIHPSKVYPSAHLGHQVATIGGVPQQVFKIPFKDIPGTDIHGLELGKVIDRVIIGPTNYPATIRDAFVIELERAGVPDAINRVFMSDIPLRT